MHRTASSPIWLLISVLALPACGSGSGGDLFDGRGTSPATGVGGSLAGSGGTPVVGAGGAGTGGSGESTGGTVQAGSGGVTTAGTGGLGGGSVGAGGAVVTGGASGQGADSGTPDGGGGSCAAPQRFYLDEDGDGFGNELLFVDACDTPAGYVTNGDDCYDGNAQAHPGQPAFFDGDRGDTSFDYDCDGASSPETNVIGKCGTFPFCSTTRGWMGTAAACGQHGAWLDSCVGLTTLCAQTSSDRVQKCR